MGAPTAITVTKNRILVDGLNFRSTWEVKIYRILNRYASHLQYEPTVKLFEKKWIKPDFVVGNVAIEVSGFASAQEKSRKQNIDKIWLYLEHTELKVLWIVGKRYRHFYDEIFINEPRVEIVSYETFIKSDFQQICNYLRLPEKDPLTQVTE